MTLAFPVFLKRLLFYKFLGTPPPLGRPLLLRTNVVVSGAEVAFMVFKILDKAS